MVWRGRDKALKLSMDGFADYVKKLKFTNWKPSGLTIHNTAEPSRKRWDAYPGETWLRNLKSYYMGMGWSAGPHWFCDGNDIWIMTDLNVSGVHSPGFNQTRLGCEMVADFNREDDDSGIGLKVKQQAAETFAVVCAHMGWPVNGETIKLHKEDPRTDHDCPGKDFEKADFLSLVENYMAGGGEHDPDWGGHVDPAKPPDKTILFRVEGKMSTFGGPLDTGMKPDEGLALFGSATAMQKYGLGDYLLPGAGGLGRRLNPEKPYIASRWPRELYETLRNLPVTVEANGKKLEMRAVDWGPAEWTGRVADLSPGGARALRLNTDDRCTVTLRKPK